MQRWVLHIDMDAFFASVEQLTRPTLRGRPVLVGGTSGRGVVAGASYEARALGARSAMPMHQARALVGFRGISVRPRHKLYSTVSRRVFQLVAARAGVIEQISIDEAFMEPPALVGASPDEVRQWANELREAIREETGLPSSIGAGAGKQAAKIGSGMAKPDGTFVISRAEESEILGPLPVRKLWGIGPVAEVKLQRMGVSTIADFAALPPKEVEISLGKAVGLSLWNIARGNDTAPVTPRAEAKSIGAEYTYPKDLITRTELDAAVDRAFTAAFRRLMSDGRGARTVNVKLKLADFHIESRSQSVLYATDDESQLRSMVDLLVRYPDEVGPIRLVGVSFSNLEKPSQEMLFPELQFVKPTTTVESDWESGVRGDNNHETAIDLPEETERSGEPAVAWFPTQDVFHPEYGHGWIQGVGHGIVTVRFETRTTTHSFTKTFPVLDEQLQAGDPLDSLDWGEWITRQEAE
ncbi:MAG: DNA polymerase IV [Corynebacterium sp.]|uniref:DNA polymerase IV n=1 Tax=Corynebacterium sp. TaxID=1720 RepID=UPI0026DC9DF9|nr:DNA polymerase IV [Corynebacterium sp.]MDO5097944.1 DNA polymerase IV [Corynebacterium sp.]